ncbi:hypothetical protein Goari_000926, partial [Gossypium aridum]|nr:hypothetical protein [Gossypium aridum]
ASSEALTQVLIPVAALVGIGFALLQWLLFSRVKVSSHDSSNGYKVKLIEADEEEEGIDNIEYKYLGIFMGVFGVIIFLFLGSVKGFSTKSEPCIYNQGNTCKPALANAVFSTIAFLLGALTSVLSGFLGMKIATYANARTTLEARKGVGKAFIIAFRSGAVMGFLLAANGLLGLYESITGYGLGGSSMALFGRVGGGIYTKAADIGADLVCKVERNILKMIHEIQLRVPTVIVDNVGDNVGDIAGMGSDLFGSYAESSCAALFVASISSFGINHNFTAMSYPLIISSMGIVVCLITTLFATVMFEIKNVREIEPSLKRQLLISTILMTAGIAMVSFFAWPSEFNLFDFGTEKENITLAMLTGKDIKAPLSTFEKDFFNK